MPKLLIIRGNSGSGKTSAAKRIRELADTKIAIVSQDTIRREIFDESEADDNSNIDLLQLITTHALDRGFDVILEGILKRKRYGDVLTQLIKRYPTHVFYLDISFEETLRRHATKPNSHEYGASEMKQWYIAQDILGIANERIIPEHFTLEETVESILNDAKFVSRKIIASQK